MVQRSRSAIIRSLLEHIDGPAEEEVDHLHHLGEQGGGNVIREHEAGLFLHQVVVEDQAGGVIRHVVFGELEDAGASVTAVAVGAEARAAVVAHLDAVVGDTPVAVDVVMAEERAHDIAVGEPSLILAGDVVEILAAGGLAQAAAVVDDLVFIQHVPLAVAAGIDGAVGVPVALLEEVVDLLHRDVLEVHGGHRHAAVGRLQLRALGVVPVKLGLGDAGVTALGGVVIGIHHIDVEHRLAAVVALDLHVAGEGIGAVLSGVVHGIPLIELIHLRLVQHAGPVMVVVAQGCDEGDAALFQRLADIVDGHAVILRIGQRIDVGKLVAHEHHQVGVFGIEDLLHEVGHLRVAVLAHVLGVVQHHDLEGAVVVELQGLIAGIRRRQAAARGERAHAAAQHDKHRKDNT